LEHLSEDQIVSYRARSLTASEVLHVSDHLAQCEACRVRASGQANVEAAAAAMRARLNSESEAFAHLTYEEMAAFVDGHAGAFQKGRVETHIGECPGCAAEVRGLRVVKSEIDPAPVKGGRAWSGWRLALTLAAAAAGIVALGIAVRPHPSAPRRVASLPRPIPPAPAPAGNIIMDGARRISISPQGLVGGLDGIPDSIRLEVERSLVAQTVEVPRGVEALAARRDILMGAPPPQTGVSLLEPLGVVVETQNPEFRWKGKAGAEYQVKVYTPDFREVATSGWIRQAEWRPPFGLRRGVRYSWQLTVRHNGTEATAPEPPEPEARFHVLNAFSERELAATRAMSPDSHVVLGIAYAHAGLIAEARQELQAAAKQNPGSVTVTALLISLNSSLRQSK
jgi:anti-sigma factor RsiW